MNSELSALLGQYLATKHARVFSESAPDDTEFPYIVFTFPNDLDDGESTRLVTVDIDGWDAPNSGDSSALDALMAAINGNGDRLHPTGLNKTTLRGSGMAAAFFLDNSFPLDDDDKRIIRRKCIYQAHVFGRS